MLHFFIDKIKKFKISNTLHSPSQSTTIVPVPEKQFLFSTYFSFYHCNTQICFSTNFNEYKTNWELSDLHATTSKSLISMKLHISSSNGFCGQWQPRTFVLWTDVMSLKAHKACFQNSGQHSSFWNIQSISESQCLVQFRGKPYKVHFTLPIRNIVREEIVHKTKWHKRTLNLLFQSKPFPPFIKCLHERSFHFYLFSFVILSPAAEKNAENSNVARKDFEACINFAQICINGNTMCSTIYVLP